MKRYVIQIEWDSEVGVWVATSDDVPGLITEAATIDALQRRLSTMIPELLSDNDCPPDERHITVDLLCSRFTIACPDSRIA